jgi:hypothetical protein
LIPTDDISQAFSGPQVDNLAVDSVAHPNLKPSFFDPSCAICAANQVPAQIGNSWAKTPKTQIVGSIPIPPDKQTLNREAEAALATAGSPLQYYQLIDTQWPTDPSAPPTPWNAGLPEQAGGQSDARVPYQRDDGDLFPGAVLHRLPKRGIAHRRAMPARPLGERDGAQQQEHDGGLDADFRDRKLYGRHSSASFHGAKATAGLKPLTGDFSWLFSQKAQ